MDVTRTLMTRNADLTARIRCQVESQPGIDTQRRRETTGKEEVGGAGKERRGDFSPGENSVGERLASLSDSRRTETGEGVPSRRGRGEKIRDTRSSGAVSRFRGSS